MAWKPALWASVIPRDPTKRKPNHVDNSARLCPAASTGAMKEALVRVGTRIHQDVVVSSMMLEKASSAAATPAPRSQR